MDDSKGAVSIDIAIPVLNEEARLERGVFGTLEMLHQLPVKGHRVTIADNGSKDRTGEIGKQLSERIAEVSYVSVGERGVGRALKAAWGASDADVVGYMDVDLATDLRHLAEVVRLFSNHLGSEVAVVNGSRRLPGSYVINRSLLRSITSHGFNWLLFNLLGVRFTDGMCGFKFLRRDIYDELSRQGLENDDWFFCTELLVKAEWAGFPIVEIPVTWTDDRNSRVRLFSTTRNYMKEILRLKSIRRRSLNRKKAI